MLSCWCQRGPVATLYCNTLHSSNCYFHMCIYLNRKKWNLPLEACFGKKKSILAILEEYSSEFKLFIFENTSQKTFSMKIPCWIKDLVKWFRLTGINYISSIDKLMIHITRYWGFLSGWLSGKESSFNEGAARVMSSIPGSGRSPGDPHDNSL